MSNPLDVVRRFMADMERLDYDRALTLVADDCDYVNPPPIGAVRGGVAVRAVLEPFFAPTLANEFKVLREAAAGPVVFLERLDRHQLADRWVELPVTGVFEVRDGKIVYWRDYFDAATILSQWPT
ncbi:MAG TPA: limonene-1,2-epoxide hydrolase family protein [Caulobacteraceae bacterium]|nr:limonene-1,2-epoxide hydrolase family protein [Caulobacteraceae bacterium]